VLTHDLSAVTVHFLCFLLVFSDSNLRAWSPTSTDPVLHSSAAWRRGRIRWFMSALHTSDPPVLEMITARDEKGGLCAVP